MITRTILASDVAKLDSNVYTGGGTDDTAALQAILDRVPEWGGLHLIMDGAALVTGLRVHSNTTIECLNKDCGFFLKSGSNCAIIRNADIDYDERHNKNISLIGGTYNHNAKGQEHHLYVEDVREGYGGGKRRFPSGEEHISFTFALRMIGVENLLMRDLTIRNQRTYAMLTCNFYNVVMENIFIDLPKKMHAQNQDGLHFHGPGRFLTIRNIAGDAGDDFIALAPDEHDCVSDITDVLIDGVFLNDADQGIRLLSAEHGRLDRVTIRNVTGTYRSFGFYMNSWEPNDVGGNFGDIVFENIDLRPTVPNYDYRPPFLFQAGGNFEHLTFRNIRDHFSRSPRTLFELSSPFHTLLQDNCRTHIKELTIDGLTVLSDSALTVPAILIDAAVDRMILRNIDISYGAQSDTPFIDFGRYGHIGTLAVNGLIANGLRTFVSPPEGAVGNTVMWNTYIPDAK